MKNAKPLNEVEADAVMSRIEDAATQKLVRFAYACARMEFIPRVGESAIDSAQRLPSAPFDMRFFVQVLIRVFSNQQVIREMLEGKSIAEATGWDV